MNPPNDELQYPIAVSLYNSEIDRLYARQSLYVGFQLAAIAGFIASLDKLAAQPVVMRIAIGLMLVLAIPWSPSAGCIPIKLYSRSSPPWKRARAAGWTC